MKKYYIILAVLGLFIGYFSKMNFWFEDAREVFFPISKAQLKAKKNAVAVTWKSASEDASPADSTPSPSTSLPQPVDLEKLSQYELFHQLYNARILQEATNHEFYFEKIKARLTSKYPIAVKTEHKSNYEKEVADRLGLLRAMSHFWPSPKEVHYDHKTIKQFFYEVANNKDENLMVRRQAYRNWLSFGNSVSRNDKGRFIASNDDRLLHLVSLSDENLIETLTESAE